MGVILVQPCCRLSKSQPRASGPGHVLLCQPLSQGPGVLEQLLISRKHLVMSPSWGNWVTSLAGEEPQYDGELSRDAVFGEGWMEIGCPCWSCGAKERMDCSGIWRALATMGVACLSKRPWKPPKGVPSISLPEEMVPRLETELPSGCPMAPAPLHSSSRRGGKDFLSSHKPRGQRGGQT